MTKIEITFLRKDKRYIQSQGQKEKNIGPSKLYSIIKEIEDIINNHKSEAEIIIK